MANLVKTISTLITPCDMHKLRRIVDDDTLTLLILDLKKFQYTGNAPVSNLSSGRHINHFLISCC